VVYFSFPELVYFYLPVDTGSVGIEITHDSASAEEAFDAVSIARSTLLWLTGEGFLRYQGSDLSGKFYGVQLTLKGLTILGSVPASVNQNGMPESIIKKIKRVLSSGVEKTSEDTLRSVLNEVFKLAFNASVSAVSTGTLRL